MADCNVTINVSNTLDCPTTAAGATIFSPVLMFLAGVLGNILSLSQLCRTRIDGRTTNFYRLVTGLVWTDLLGILLTSPSVIMAYVNGRHWYGGEIHCRFHGFAMVCFGIATPLIICAMAVERFVAVKCVFFYSNNCKSSVATSGVLLLWLSVLLYGLFPLIGFGEFKLQHPGTWCFLDFHTDSTSSKLYAYIYAVTILLLTLIICVCNTYVAITIFKTRRLKKMDRKASVGAVQSCCRSSEEGSTNSRITKNSDIEVQMIVLLCALTVVFAVCWTPMMVNIIATMVTGRANKILDLTTVRLASLNQTLDPWLYILLRRSFCTKICRKVKRIVSCCTSKSNPDLYSVDNGGHYLPVNVIKTPHKALYLRDSESVPDECDVDIQNGAVPDVTSNLSEHNASPLPDVTNTSSNNNPGCICRLQFGKSSLSEKEDGIFVRIMYSRGSTRNTHTDDSLS
ncbi:Prostaglandin E receptor 3 (subtype EP3) [Mactra antiquata]